MKKTICAVVTSAIIGLSGIAGAAPKEAPRPDVKKYMYSGELGDEQVNFKYSYRGVMLEVTDKSKRRFSFEDNDGDLKLDFFYLRDGYATHSYSRTEFPEILEKAQKRFDGYLPKLEKARTDHIEMKRRKALDILGIGE